jgi:hypothetical protein
LILLIFFGLGATQESSLIQFELKDQFDKKYSQQDFLGRICILVGSDKEGSQYNDRWSLTIFDSLSALGLQDSIKFLAVANLKGVPRLFRGLVKSKFPKGDSQSILLDWNGIFAQTYQFVPDVSNIILFDRSGNQVFRIAVTELDPAKLDAFVEEIVRLID